MTSGVPSAALPEALVGSSAVLLGNRIGARLMANIPRPKVEASRRSGSAADVGRLGRTDRPGWACPCWGRCCPATGSDGDVDMGQIAPLRHRAERRVGEERPCLAVVDRLVHARIGADEEHRVKPAPAGSVALLGMVYCQSATIEVRDVRQVVRRRVRIGRRVVALAEDGVGQVEDVAGAAPLMLTHVGVALVAEGIESAM